jgi:hypothetical protein
MTAHSSPPAHHSAKSSDAGEVSANFGSLLYPLGYRRSGASQSRRNMETRFPALHAGFGGHGALRRRRAGWLGRASLPPAPSPRTDSMRNMTTTSETSGRPDGHGQGMATTTAAAPPPYVDPWALVIFTFAGTSPPVIAHRIHALMVFGLTGLPDGSGLARRSRAGHRRRRGRLVTN